MSIIKPIDLENPERLREVLEGNDAKQEELIVYRDELIKKQAEILRNLIIQLKPIMQHIHLRCRFIHPSFKGISTKLGPILDYDEEQNLLYVFCIESDTIVSFHPDNPNQKKRKHRDSPLR